MTIFSIGLVLSFFITLFSISYGKSKIDKIISENKKGIFKKLKQLTLELKKEIGSAWFYGIITLFLLLCIIVAITNIFNLFFFCSSITIGIYGAKKLYFGVGIVSDFTNRVVLYGVRMFK